jgi:hypothetical protein
MKILNKIWFFVEGDAEHELVKCLTYQNPDRLKLFKDFKEFRKIDTNQQSHIPCYCENCEDVDKIGKKIEELTYLIERVDKLEIIVICDLEKLCNSSRKDEITRKITKLNPTVKINFSFFNPKIENFYLENKDIVKNVIKKTYKEKFQREAPQIDLEPNISSKIYLIEQSFKKYGLRYKKPNFAENFFSQFNFMNSDNNAIKRILRFINNNINMEDLNI